MNQFDHVKVRLNFRPEYKGREIKSGLVALNGKELILEVLWLMDEDDPYPGEFALGGIDRETKELLLSFGIGWLASGDVEVFAQCLPDCGLGFGPSLIISEGDNYLWSVIP